MNQIYKGYVPLKGKTPLIKYTKDELLTLQQAEKHSGFAGVLAEGVILVDIDNENDSNIIFNILKDKGIDCPIFQTTRGKHFLFKNTNLKKTMDHQTNALGIVCDIKNGDRNGLQVLKRNGNIRQLISGSLESELPVLPAFLHPVNTDIDFQGLKDGDGRNSTLYNYILKLQSHGFSRDETAECLQVINKFMFSDPLTEKEMDVILRDGAFKSDKTIFFDENKFLFDKFARFLISELHLVNVNGQIHIYKSGIYQIGYKYIESKMIDYIPTLRQSQRTEVLRYIDLLMLNEPDRSTAGEKYIAFKNGILNLETMKLLDFTSDIIITNKIPWDWNPEAYSETVDTVLNRLACNDNDIRQAMLELTGYLLLRRNELRKFFILLGDKHNGKSTYIRMLETMTGSDNYASLDLKDLGDRFRTIEICGKLCNLGDDIDDNYISNTAILKKIISGETIIVERKGCDPFQFKPYCKLVFSANVIPRIKDSTGAVLNRMVIIPFNASFSKNDPDFDPFIIDKVTDQTAMEYLIYQGVQGLKRVLSAREFTQAKQIVKELEEYERENDSIVTFIDETGLEVIKLKPTNEVYYMYVSFCDSSGLKPLSKSMLSRRLKAKYNIQITVKRDGNKILKYYE